MSPTFTDDDIGKAVETSAGERLGVVADVDPETAYVDPAAGATDATRAALEWDGGEEPIPLTDDAVDEITDDAVRLEAEFRTESITAGSTGEADRDEGSPGDDRGSVAHDPGEPVASNPTEPGTDAGDSGPGTRDPEAAEPMREDDEFYDTAEGGARVDPADEMEPPAETDAADAADGTEETADTESDPDESTDRSDVDVDPADVTDDPEAEIEPGEDVGHRRGSDGSSE